MAIREDVASRRWALFHCPRSLKTSLGHVRVIGNNLRPNAQPAAAKRLGLDDNVAASVLNFRPTQGTLALALETLTVEVTPGVGLGEGGIGAS